MNKCSTGYYNNFLRERIIFGHLYQLTVFLGTTRSSVLVSSLETAFLHIFLLLWDLGCSWKELVLALCLFLLQLLAGNLLLLAVS